MLRIILAAVSCAALVHATMFEHCSDPKVQTAVTVHSLNISPMPITLPGDITFSINATVNRPINQIFIETELSKLTFGTIPVKIPCIGDTNIGSCTGIDACSLMGKILNGSSVVSASLGQQIDKMFIAALGHSAQCPIQPEEVVVNNFSLHLDALPSGLDLITDGDYQLTIKIKEDATAPEDVGCVKFDAQLAVGATPVG